MTTMTEKLMASLAQRLTKQIDFKQVEIITMILLGKQLDSITKYCSEKRRTKLRSFRNDERFKHNSLQGYSNRTCALKLDHRIRREIH